MYRDFQDMGIRFFLVYKSVAHPGLEGFVEPFTIEERIKHVRAAKLKFGCSIPWLVDTLNNDLKHAVGAHANSDILLNETGKVLQFRKWSDPDLLRRDLEKLVGLPEKNTAEVKMWHVKK